MKHFDADILSPDFVLLVLVGKAFQGVNGQAFGNELAALTAPAPFSALLIGEDVSAGGTKELGWVNVWIFHNASSLYHISSDTSDELFLAFLFTCAGRRWQRGQISHRGFGLQ